MTYCTLDDLIEVFGEAEVLQLMDRDADGLPDAGYVAAVLSDVDAEIDSYLRVRYALPLTEIPNRLRAIACDCARYRCYPLATPDAVRQRYEAARGYLKDLAAGRAQLDLPTPPAPSSETGIPAYLAPERLFDADTLASF